MPLTFHHNQLPNGLDIVAERNPDAHSVALGLFVKTGSRDESADVNGVSHFLEHMMFKGSAKYGWEDVNRIFDEIGARYNAFTSQELRLLRQLLHDLCTPSELRALAERWQVARLLDGTDLSYRDIHEGTGVSTTTIVRVGRFLRQESYQGYRRAIDALEGTDVG